MHSLDKVPDVAAAADAAAGAAKWRTGSVQPVPE